MGASRGCAACQWDPGIAVRFVWGRSGTRARHHRKKVAQRKPAAAEPSLALWLRGRDLLAVAGGLGRPDTPCPRVVPRAYSMDGATRPSSQGVPGHRSPTPCIGMDRTRTWFRPLSLSRDPSLLPLALPSEASVSTVVVADAADAGQSGAPVAGDGPDALSKAEPLRWPAPRAHGLWQWRESLKDVLPQAPGALLPPA